MTASDYHHHHHHHGSVIMVLYSVFPEPPQIPMMIHGSVSGTKVPIIISVIIIIIKECLEPPSQTQLVKAIVIIMARPSHASIVNILLYSKNGIRRSSMPLSRLSAVLLTAPHPALSIVQSTAVGFRIFSENNSV